MNQHDEHWLEEQLFRAIHAGKVEFDSEQWQQKYPEEYALLSAAGTGGAIAPEVERQGSWRIIMSSKVTKFAIAAALIIAVGVGMMLIGGPDMPKVAWASVVAKLENIETLKNKVFLTVERIAENQTDELDFTVHRSQEYGIRRDTYMGTELVSVLYLPAQGNEFVEVVPPMKKYVTGTMSSSILDKAKSTDLTLMVTELMKMDYVEIGSKTINGIEAEGIQFTDPKFGAYLFDNGAGELWVDPLTNLPVYLIAEGDAANGAVHMKLVVDQFEWSTELDAEDFEPDIPRGYTLLADTGEMGTEESALEGLRGYAELSDGLYPHKLSLTDVNLRAGEALEARGVGGGEGMREPTQEEYQVVINIQSTCIFFAEMIGADNDAAYYGETVTAADVDKVLLRWQVGEDEYRVIFGDLRAENVSTQRLAELEGR